MFGMRRALLILALTAGLMASASANAAPPIHQLRVYGLHDTTKAAFHARFRDHAVRIMNRHGFKILGMWEANGERGPEFVYLLEWPDEAAMTAAWTAFRADQEWIDIKRATPAADQPIVGEIQERTLRLTDYSPAFGPAR